MNKVAFASIAAACALDCSTGAIAQSMSNAGYKSAKDGIAAEYMAASKGCHTAMKPKTGDKETRAPLARQGAAALTASVIEGKGTMPSKGTTASDAGVKLAVEYMLSQSK